MTDQIIAKQTWYDKTAEDTSKILKVDPRAGLSGAEAQERLNKYGPNRLEGKKKESTFVRFLRQYKDLMQIVLIVAAAINYIFTKDTSTTIVLVGLTIFNATMGMNQEAKAQASLASLEKMLKNIARVRRDGVAIEIDSEQIVPGDIVLMEAGNKVPADGRLIVSATLEIEEAALTGESLASPKQTDAIQKPDLPIGDRSCMAFMNTSVTRGRGEMIVTDTGMSTEMGHIAKLLNATESDKTPLQKELDKLTMIIAAIAGIVLVVMVILGRKNGEPPEEIFTAGVALAIAAIPTGMPAIVTTLYSMGTQVLAKSNAIVKKLPSVETLGSVSAICSDKTGTLTLNKMTARDLAVPGAGRFTITGEGYSTVGQIQHSTNEKIDLTDFLLPMALCCDAVLNGEELIGDPTEGALIVLAEKGGISVEHARQNYPRIAEVPFDSDYKFMATFHEFKDESGKPVIRAFVKGAPDVLIARSGYYWGTGGKHGPITEENKELAMEANAKLAAAGERIMVVARKDFDPKKFNPKSNLIDSINDLVLLAMVGIVDPPRAEAKDAIAKCKSAGIQVRMITGDHAVTAAAIGKELGITGRAITGAEFAALSEEEALAQLPEIGVIARVSPEDKIRLVTLLQKMKNIVAMTGDGVNDAPALKKADIGVAMGITGTEVSKDSAVMILTDDNFATIVKAVEFGRGIYDNLMKYIRFQMEALVAFIGTFLGAAIFQVANGVPFGPVLLLWINFFVQVPIALGLGYDEPLGNLMERKPRPLNQPVISRNQWIRISIMGGLIAFVVLYFENMYWAESPAMAITFAATLFSVLNISIGLTVRDEFQTIFNREYWSKLNVIKLFGLSLLITILATELGFLQRILGTQSLSQDQWTIIFWIGILYVVVDEIVKLGLRKVKKIN